MTKEEIIRAELDSNPGLYSVMTAEQVVIELNAVDKVQTRNSIPGTELFGYTDQTEYEALTDPLKAQWLSLCAIQDIPKNAVAIIKSIFSAITTTWTNIIKTETVSRAEQIGIGRARVGEVERARAL